MTTANVLTLCFTCKEETTTYPCAGCSKHFCFDDLATHRESLESQFHEIEHQRNEFMQILSDQQKDNVNNHPLIKQINGWERMSIEKIRQTANEQRQLIQQSIHEQTKKIQVKLDTLTEEMQNIAKRKAFNEMVLNNLGTQLEKLKKQLNQPAHIVIKEDSSPAYIQKLSTIISSTTNPHTFYRHQLRSNINWKQQAKTVAGGNGKEDKLNQLNHPIGIYVDDQQRSIYIAEYKMHCIIKWKLGENNGQIIAGGNGSGNRINQFNGPTDVIIDKTTNNLIICDNENRRVVRWSLENQQDKQIIIEDIKCYGLMMNDNGDLFVSDEERHEVKRWKKGEKGEGTIVAGGNGKGDKLNQLDEPTFIFVDQQETVYVSDWGNHHVMKWLKGAKEGKIVAGGQGSGSRLNQLDCPQGLIVNKVGDVYVADYENNRIVCWPTGSTEGRVVAGGNGEGRESNQFHSPIGLSFDAENNLYIVDQWNNRIQQLEVE